MDTQISDDGFIHAMQNLNGGAIVDELDRGVMDCLQAINDHGGNAEITLKVKLKKDRGLDGVVILTPEVNIKMPKEAPIGSIFFESKGNGLTTQHQHQERLNLEEAVQNSKPSLTPVGTVSHLNNEAS